MTNNISETLRMMDVVDGIQHARLQKSGLVENDADLMAKVREVYVSQGLPVDDEVLGIAFQKLYGRLPGEEQSLVPLIARDEAGGLVRPVFPKSRIIEEKFAFSTVAMVVFVTLLLSGAWMWLPASTSMVPVSPVATNHGLGDVAGRLDKINDSILQVGTASIFFWE